MTRRFIYSAQTLKAAMFERAPPHFELVRADSCYPFQPLEGCLISRLPCNFALIEVVLMMCSARVD